MLQRLVSEFAPLLFGAEQLVNSGSMELFLGNLVVGLEQLRLGLQGLVLQVWTLRTLQTAIPEA